MISIGKFLSLKSEADQTLVSIVRLLAEGIGRQAGAGESEECARFRQTNEEFSGALTEGTPHAELLVRVGSVLKGFDEYNHQVAKQQRLQTVELRNMVQMLAATVKTVTSASDSQLSVLGDIEQRIAKVSGLDDVRLIKARLQECLYDIRKEAELQQKRSADTIEDLNQRLDDSRLRAARVENERPNDEITGLPARPEAEAALSECARTGERTYAAVMVLDRLQAVNAQFGREAGDQILTAFTRMVQKQLGAQDRLFRWGGPTLLALLPRPAALETVRIEVGRVMATKLEHTVQTPSRSLLLVVSARWTLCPVMAAVRLTCQKIDTFAASPALRE